MRYIEKRLARTVERVFRVRFVPSTTPLLLRAYVTSFRIIPFSLSPPLSLSFSLSHPYLPFPVLSLSLSLSLSRSILFAESPSSAILLSSYSSLSSSSSSCNPAKPDAPQVVVVAQHRRRHRQRNVWRGSELEYHRSASGLLVLIRGRKHHRYTKNRAPRGQVPTGPARRAKLIPLIGRRLLVVFLRCLVGLYQPTG